MLESIKPLYVKSKPVSNIRFVNVSIIKIYFEIEVKCNNKFNKINKL